MIPAAAYAMIFLFGSILITIEIPSLFPEEFGLNTQQVGLQFLSLIIGSVIGEQIGGISSDRWMSWRAKRIQRQPQPEFRLWLSYIGHVLTIVGIVVCSECSTVLLHKADDIRRFSWFNLEIFRLTT